MTKSTTKIPISSIIFEEDIYPRKGIDHKRVGIFAENIRDGFKFEPIEVELYPDRPGKYRLLDGVHRWGAYKTVGMMEPEAIIKDLKGTDPLLYAAKKAIGRARRTVDSYITDLRAATQLSIDLKIFRMNWSRHSARPDCR